MTDSILHNPNDLAHSSKLRAWGRLLRLPNLLTVPGDPIAGLLLAMSAGARPELWLMLPLGLAALLLYAAGLLANDYFDLEEDRLHRPHRPLPAGQVKPWVVILMALVFTALGILAARWAGPAPAILAGAIAAAVFVYDMGGKALPFFGPLNMGLCRGLSLALGAAAAGMDGVLSAPVILSAVGLTVYIAAVTQIAAGETKAVALGLKRFAPAGVVAAWWLGLVFLVEQVALDQLAVSLVLAWVAAMACAAVGWRLGGVPAPARVQKSIGSWIRLLLVIQAGLAAACFPAGLPFAGILLLLWPAHYLLARKFYAS
jgi:4-hydroxybenzoate polyprenyltransferase